MNDPGKYTVLKSSPDPGSCVSGLFQVGLISIWSTERLLPPPPGESTPTNSKADHTVAAGGTAQLSADWSAPDNSQGNKQSDHTQERGEHHEHAPPDPKHVSVDCDHLLKDHEHEVHDHFHGDHEHEDHKHVRRHGEHDAVIGQSSHDHGDRDNGYHHRDGPDRQQVHDAEVRDDTKHSHGHHHAHAAGKNGGEHDHDTDYEHNDHDDHEHFYDDDAAEWRPFPLPSTQLDICSSKLTQVE